MTPAQSRAIIERAESALAKLDAKIARLEAAHAERMAPLRAEREADAKIVNGLREGLGAPVAAEKAPTPPEPVTTPEPTPRPNGGRGTVEEQIARGKKIVIEEA